MKGLMAGGWCVVFLCGVFSISGAQWQSAGCADRHILSIAAIGGDKPGVLAGTDQGLYFIGKQETKISSVESRPIRSVEVLAGRAVVAASNGSMGDGIFLGTQSLATEPYWGFISFLSVYPYLNHEVMTWRSGANDDTVFIGARNTVNVTQISGSIITQSELPVPEFCFGGEPTTCRALHIFSHDKRLYAGGHSRDTDTGTGGLLVAKTMANDTMVLLKRLKVTAIAEGFSETNGLQLYIATIDTGILHFSDPYQNTLWGHIPAPNNEPINHMVMMESALMSQILCVAVNSGVYLRVGSAWRELGNIPKTPLCLAFTGGGLAPYALYAGTYEGVYRLDSLVTAIHGSVAVAPRPSSVALTNTGNGRVHIHLSLAAAAPVSVDLIDMAGRHITTLLRREFSAGNHLLHQQTGAYDGARNNSGVYVVRVNAADACAHTKIVMINR